MDDQKATFSCGKMTHFAAEEESAGRTRQNQFVSLLPHEPVEDVEGLAAKHHGALGVLAEASRRSLTTNFVEVRWKGWSGLPWANFGGRVSLGAVGVLRSQGLNLQPSNPTVVGNCAPHSKHFQQIMQEQRLCLLCIRKCQSNFS